MKRPTYLIFYCSVVFISSTVHAQDQPIRIDFSGGTVEDNHITVMGAGFGEYPMADITFQDIPMDNAYEGATDGKGSLVIAEPGEGILIIGPKIQTTNPAMIRCSVRTNNPNVSVIIASLDHGPRTFVSSQTVNDSNHFLHQYKRLTTFYVPPSGEFQPLIQVLNTSETEMIIVYLDNFDVFILDRNRYYSPNFLDGDEFDSITTSIIDDLSPTPTPTPIPTISFGPTITIPLDLPQDAKPLEMVLIPSGSFIMGCSSTERGYYGNEWPLHQVTITNDFYMGKYEVTYAQYADFLQATGKKSGVDWTHTDCPLRYDDGVYTIGGKYGKSWNQPMIFVSWYGAAMFCNYLSEKEGLQPVYNESGYRWDTLFFANGYRLPTEAEWEYACRAGTSTRFSHGDVFECSDRCELCLTHDQYMWWCGNNSPYGTKEVGLKLPNPWGLYDMHGNVWEWCTDHWEDPFKREDQIDPVTLFIDIYRYQSDRVSRGGFWNTFASYCRSSFRGGLNPDINYYNSLGFRIVRLRTI